MCACSSGEFGFIAPALQSLGSTAPEALAQTSRPPPGRYTAAGHVPLRASSRAPPPLAATPLRFEPTEAQPPFPVGATSASPPGPWVTPPPDYWPRPRNPGPRLLRRRGVALRDDVTGRARWRASSLLLSGATRPDDAVGKAEQWVALGNGRGDKPDGTGRLRQGFLLPFAVLLGKGGGRQRTSGPTAPPCLCYCAAAFSAVTPSEEWGRER